MLANILIDLDDRINIKMSSLKSVLRSNNFPLPFGTAIETSDPNQPMMFEFSPFEAGSLQLGSFVPIEQFGNEFKEGKFDAKRSSDEKSLGYYLGLFGAAFSFRLSELIDILGAKKYLQNIANQLNSQQLKPAYLPNMNYKIKNAARNEYQTLKLSDAGHGLAGREGLGTNLPMLSALRPERKIDIIIVYDSSASLKNAPALRAAINEAFENNLRMPPIKPEELRNIEHQDVSIFTDPLCPSNGPMIIYLQGRLLDGRAPHVRVDGGYLGSSSKIKKMRNPAQELYPSSKFIYSKEEIQDLANLGMQKITSNRDRINNAISNWIRRKNQ